MKTKIKNFVLYFFAFSIILLLSESLFFYRNRTFDLVKTGVNVSDFFLKKKDLNKTLYFLNISSNLYVKKNKEYFPLMNLKSMTNPSLGGIDSSTTEEVSKFLLQRLDDVKNDSSPQKISSLYYNIALILSSHNYKEQSRTFFQTSIDITPAVGFLYFELSNSYFNDGDFERGIQILENCKKIKQLTDVCNAYIGEHSTNDKKIEVGAYKELTDKYLLGKEDVSFSDF